VNSGLTLCNGHWIHILHDDDYVLPGFYRTMREAVEVLPSSTGVACCGCLLVEEESVLSKPQPSLQPVGGVLAHWLERLAVRNQVNMPSVIVRRDVYERVGVYCEDIASCADWDFHLRAAMHYDWWYVSEVLAAYRIHSDSVTGRLGQSGRLAQDLRLTLERAAGYLPVEVLDAVLPTARRLHARDFAAQAAQAFHVGQTELGTHLTRQALALVDMEHVRMLGV
jgi:hypothetical protein